MRLVHTFCATHPEYCQGINKKRIFFWSFKMAKIKSNCHKLSTSRVANVFIPSSTSGVYLNMYARVCDCVRVCVQASLRRISSPFMLSQGLALVLFLQMFPPSCLSLSFFFYVCLLSEFPFLRDEKLTFKLSMSCCLLPLSNASTDTAQIPTPFPSLCNWWVREMFSLQTNMLCSIPYLNILQRWCGGRKTRRRTKNLICHIFTTVSVKHDGNKRLCLKPKLLWGNMMYVQTQD